MKQLAYPESRQRLEVNQHSRKSLDIGPDKALFSNKKY